MIPFNRASLTGLEIEYILAALEAGHISGDGTFTRRCQALIEQYVGVQKAFLTTSCTHALEMTALLLDIAPGDEVVVPSFTFPSTVNAFVLRGAKPIFSDVREDTLNLDHTRLETLITSRTRAIVVVHYAGISCEMDTIMDIADRRGITVIEDNAHGLFGAYKGKQLGTFGEMSTLSFHETKNITCGEGGALLLNKSDFLRRAEIIREKGTNRSRFFRGEVDKYSWVDLGSSYVPSDLLAAFLLAQLEHYKQIQETRGQLFERYQETLRDWAIDNGTVLPHIPEGCQPSYHLYHLRLPNLAERTRFIESLKERGVHSVFHYLPLHTSPMGRRFGYMEGDCPVSERVSDQVVRLPFFVSLKAEEQQHIINAVTSFRVGQ